MPIKSLDDLFLHTLKDILYAERQILKSLPKMERKASSDDLKKAFSSHKDETEGQIDRLEKCFEHLDKAARGAKCDAIIGIIEETEDLMDEIEDAETLDAALIASAQAVEHYEITRYGTLVTWAETLGHSKIAKLLEENLAQEEEADEKLSHIAKGGVNKKAA